VTQIYVATNISLKDPWQQYESPETYIIKQHITVFTHFDFKFLTVSELLTFANLTELGISVWRDGITGKKTRQGLNMGFPFDNFCGVWWHVTLIACHVWSKSFILSNNWFLDIPEITLPRPRVIATSRKLIRVYYCYVTQINVNVIFRPYGTEINCN